MPQLIGNTVFGLRPRVFLGWVAAILVCVGSWVIVVSWSPVRPDALAVGDYVSYQGNGQWPHAVYRSSPFRWATHRVVDVSQPSIFFARVDDPKHEIGLQRALFVTEIGAIHETPRNDTR